MKRSKFRCPNPWQALMTLPKQNFSNRRTPHVGCVRMAITVATIIGNVCSSRHRKDDFFFVKRKADLESSRICIPTLASLTLLVA
jgi:hypothetical protein